MIAAALSELLKDVADDEKLSELASEKQIDTVLIKDTGMSLDPKKMRADAVRALVGAVFLDQGRSAAMLLMEKFGIRVHP